MSSSNKDTCETVISEYKQRLFKYVVISILVGAAAKWVASHKLTNEEIAIISLTAGTVFMLLDIYTPSVKFIEKKNKE